MGLCPLSQLPCNLSRRDIPIALGQRRTVMSSRVEILPSTRAGLRQQRNSIPGAGDRKKWSNQVPTSIFVGGDLQMRAEQGGNAYGSDHRGCRRLRDRDWKIKLRWRVGRANALGLRHPCTELDGYASDLLMELVPDCASDGCSLRSCHQID